MLKKIFFYFFLVSINSFGQQTLDVAEGDILSSSGSISYSVNQIDDINIINNNYIISLGVQQPTEFFTLHKLKTKSLNLSRIKDLNSVPCFLKITPKNKVIKIFKLIKV